MSITFFDLDYLEDNSTAAEHLFTLSNYISNSEY